MDSLKSGSLIKAILVAIITSIGVPFFGSLAFSVLLAPFVWFYGLAVAVLLFPMSLLLTLPAAVWFGIRTYLANWFGRAEAVGAVAVSVVVTSFIVSSDKVLGENALPAILGDGRSIGQLTILLVGLAFASIGAVATQLLLARTPLLRNRKGSSSVPRSE